MDAMAGLVAASHVASVATSNLVTGKSLAIAAVWHGPLVVQHGAAACCVVSSGCMHMHACGHGMVWQPVMSNVLLPRIVLLLGQLCIGGGQVFDSSPR